MLLLGEQFHATAEPWTQIQQLVGSQGTRDEFLGALDAIGEGLTVARSFSLMRSTKAPEYRGTGDDISALCSNRCDPSRMSASR